MLKIFCIRIRIDILSGVFEHLKWPEKDMKGDKRLKIWLRRSCHRKMDKMDQSKYKWWTQKNHGICQSNKFTSTKVRWLTTNASKFCEKFDFWKVFIQNHNRQIQHSVSIYSLWYLTSRRLCMTRIQTVSKPFQIAKVDFWVLLLFEQNFSNQRVLGIISDLVISSKLFEIFE